MQKITIELPSIRDDQSGYSFLFKLVNRILNDPYNFFDFNFKKCSILEQNAVTLLGGLAGYVDSKNTLANKVLGGMLVPRCGVMFLVDTMSPLIRNALIKNNFLSHFSKANFDGYPEGDYIGYRQHNNYLDANAIAAHLNHEWLSDEKIYLSPNLKWAIVSRIFEIFMNAYGHGVERSDIDGLGVISCGQYKEKEGELKLAVLDFGKGIVETVKSHIKQDITDIEAMNWALTSGNSTRTDSVDDDIPRGLGFGLLSDFVSVNKGEFKIFSNTCCAHVNSDGKYEIEKMKTPFSGTLVNISINCDDRYYKFISEQPNSECYF